jgi:predicted alpha/beta hydrolase
MTPSTHVNIDPSFFITPEELRLQFTYQVGRYAFSFRSTTLSFAQWRDQSSAKLAELLGFQQPELAPAQDLRQTTVTNVRIHALRMAVSDDLSLPAYLLVPLQPRASSHLVLALHGHGEVEPCIGSRDDYHHHFALSLAQHGYIVLCPELRGFGALRNLARDRDGYRLDYWQWGSHMAYSLVIDGFQRGHTLLGDTTADLLRWEHWLATIYPNTPIDVVGISYGGDLALCYPIFSSRVARIFASGTLGSFEPIFARGYNAPAHCIPGIVHWLDRADIAGLNAPRPVAFHYGALDVPGSDNYSASYNETVSSAVAQVRAIYEAADARQHVHLLVSEGKHHEIDLDAVLQFLTT